MHTQLRTVSSFCMECMAVAVGGGVSPGQCMMIYVYGFCDDNSVHAVAEYQKRFPNRTSRGISHLISTRAVYFMHQR